MIHDDRGSPQNYTARQNNFCPSCSFVYTDYINIYRIKSRATRDIHKPKQPTSGLFFMFNSGKIIIVRESLKTRFQLHIYVCVLPFYSLTTCYWWWISYTQWISWDILSLKTILNLYYSSSNNTSNNIDKIFIS